MKPYTKLALVSAFYSLAENKQIDAITVKSLTDETEMNPKTFYYHFDGISDLLKWNFERELTALFSNHPVSAESDWGNDVLKIMTYLEENQVFLRRLTKSRYWPEMRFFFCSMYERYCAELLKGVIRIVEKTDGIPTIIHEDAFNLNVSFYGLLFYSYAERWVLNGCVVPREAYFQSCIDVIGEKAMHEAVRRFRIQA